MTLVIQGKFECATADLGTFLAASAMLPDELEDGTNPLAQVQQPDLSWWQPALLQDTSGVECAWESGADVASCRLAAGRSAQGDRTIVYFIVVYENKSQTGFRPDVKTDPNWRQ